MLCVFVFCFLFFCFFVFFGARSCAYTKKKKKTKKRAKQKRAKQKRAKQKKEKSKKRKKMRGGVYVLRLIGGRFYVGSSHDIDARIASHRAGTGSAFTRAFGVECEEPPATRAMDDYESWERAETLWRARTHGFDFVRGWMWTTLRLTHAHRAEFKRQLAERFSACRSCGSLDHFIEQCDRRADHRPVVFRRVRRTSAREDRSERRNTPPIS